MRISNRFSREQTVARRSPLLWVAGLALTWPLASGAAAFDKTISIPGMSSFRPGVLHVADRIPRRDAGWLGVQLAPVPAAVASQLQLDQAGVMVRNLFRDSPADQAGLERYDVIVRVDGQEVDRGIGMFSRHVRNKGPGDSITLTLYRGGRQMEVAATLGSAPRRFDQRALKYEDDPDVAEHRLFGLRGKILRPGPQGWILDDLGELPELPQPEEWFEPSKPRDDQVEAECELQEGRRVDGQGRVLHVRKHTDGTIEVRRFESGQRTDEVEPETYASLDELRQADPEAADLLGQMSEGIEDRASRSQPHLDQLEVLPRYLDSMKQYQDAMREHMDRYRRDMGRRPPSPPVAPRWRDWSGRIMPPVRPWGPPLPRTIEPLPEARFERHPNGSISVEVFDGPNRLNLTFRDEQEFEQQAPELYDRYRATLRRVR